MYAIQLLFRLSLRLTLDAAHITPSLTYGYRQMTALDYLMKFRKISSLESLEKLFDHLNYSLTDTNELMNMYRAADHRRAELVSGGRLYDLGCVPKTVWRYVV